MPDVNRQYRNLSVQRSLIGLMVLMLAVLNPVSCLIHCAIMDARLQAARVAFFLCDHGEPVVVHDVHPTTAPLPRAVYEAAPGFAAVPTFTLTLLIVFVLRPLRHPASLRFQPPTPPPRTSILQRP